MDAPEQQSVPVMQVVSNDGREEMGMQLQDMFSNMTGGGGGGRKKRRTVKVKEALEILQEGRRAVPVIPVVSSGWAHLARDVMRTFVRVGKQLGLK